MYLTFRNFKTLKIMNFFIELQSLQIGLVHLVQKQTAREHKHPKKQKKWLLATSGQKSPSIGVCHTDLPSWELPSWPPPTTRDSLPDYTTVDPVPYIRAKRYCYFVNFALKDYQWYGGMCSWYGVRGVVAFGSNEINPFTNPIVPSIITAATDF